MTRRRSRLPASEIDLGALIRWSFGAEAGRTYRAARAAERVKEYTRRVDTRALQLSDIERGSGRR